MARRAAPANAASAAPARQSHPLTRFQRRHEWAHLSGRLSRRRGVQPLRRAGRAHLAGGHADYALEGPAERRLRLVSEALSDVGDSHSTLAQPRARQVDAPARNVAGAEGGSATATWTAVMNGSLSTP